MDEKDGRGNGERENELLGERRERQDGGGREGTHEVINCAMQSTRIRGQRSSFASRPPVQRCHVFSTKSSQQHAKSSPDSCRSVLQGG